MRTRHRIIAFIKQSKLAQIALAVITSIIIFIFIIPAISHTIYTGVMASIMTMIFRAAFLIAVVGASFFLTKNEIYKRHTGRKSLIADQRRYGRSQIDLMDHFAPDPRKMDIASMPARPWTRCDGLIFGKIDNRTVCRPSDHDGNAILFAAPGVGKTMGQIIPSAMQFNGSVFAIDIKGDISTYTIGKRRIKFFDPDDSGSCHFDPLETVRTADPTMRGLAIEQIADILIPQTSKGDSSYFEQGAHDLFCGITAFCFVKKPSVPFPNIVKAALTKDVSYWINVINNSDIFEAKKYTSDLTENNKKNLSGCYSHMAKCLRSFTLGNLMILLTPSDNMIVPSDLDNGIYIYLRVKQESVLNYGKILSVICNTFLSAFKARPDAVDNRRLRPILFMLDEAPVVLRFLSASQLSEAMSTLRSRSVTTFLAAQSLSQMIMSYGDHGLRTIMDTCRYVSVMSATDPESQRYFAEMIGKTKTLKSMGQSSSESEEYIVRPETLSDLDDKVVILADGKYIIAEKIKCWQDVRPASKETKKSDTPSLLINPDFLLNDTADHH